MITIFLLLLVRKEKKFQHYSFVDLDDNIISAFIINHGLMDINILVKMKKWLNLIKQ